MKTTRINLEVPTETRARLRELQSATDSATMSEVFRKAIALLEAVNKIQANGGKLSVDYPDGSTETLTIIGVSKP